MPSNRILWRFRLRFFAIALQDFPNLMTLLDRGSCRVATEGVDCRSLRRLTARRSHRAAAVIVKTTLRDGFFHFEAAENLLLLFFPFDKKQPKFALP